MQYLLNSLTGMDSQRKKCNPSPLPKTSPLAQKKTKPRTVTSFSINNLKKKESPVTSLFFLCALPLES